MYKMGRSNLPSSSISLRLRDSLRSDGGVNIVNIAVGNPVRHFASRKIGDTRYQETMETRGCARRMARAKILRGRRERESVNVKLSTGWDNRGAQAYP